MSGRFVRASKYRHVHGEPYKPDKCFTGLSIALPNDGNCIKANTTFFAFATSGGGGPLVVHRLDKPGRFGNLPSINVHKAAVLDWDFSPFQENLIATASDDGTLRITIFPEEGLTQTIDTPNAVLEGHQKKVTFVTFHPTALNVAATSSADCTIRIWDVEKQSEKSCVAFPETVSFDWSRNGNLLAVACKDKTTKIYDPRAPNAVTSGPAPQGAKAARVAWVDPNCVVSVGFTPNAARTMSLIDIRKMEELKTVDIDQAAGSLIPFFDYDCNILYLAGKGDASVKYFEYDNPELHYLTEFHSNEPQKGFGFISKRACDTKVCEIARGLRVMRDAIVPVSFQVPRKSDLFQEDIFPDTYAGIPAMSADEYFAGQNKDAPTVSMKPGQAASHANKPAASFKSPAGEIAQLKAELEKAHHEIAHLKAELAKLGHPQ